MNTFLYYVVETGFLIYYAKRCNCCICLNEVRCAVICKSVLITCEKCIEHGGQ